MSPWQVRFGLISAKTYVGGVGEWHPSIARWLTVSWLPVHWDQLLAQCSVSSMGSLYIFYRCSQLHIVVARLTKVWTGVARVVERLHSFTKLQCCTGLHIWNCVPKLAECSQHFLLLTSAAERTAVSMSLYWNIVLWRPVTGKSEKWLTSS